VATGRGTGGTVISEGGRHALFTVFHWYERGREGKDDEIEGGLWRFRDTATRAWQEIRRCGGRGWRWRGFPPLGQFAVLVQRIVVPRHDGKLIHILLREGPDLLELLTNLDAISCNLRRRPPRKLPRRSRSSSSSSSKRSRKRITQELLLEAGGSS
jgi:hypothetical protein